MRIAFLPTMFANEYAESSHITLILLAKELIKNGHDVYIISEGIKGFPEYELFKGIPIYRGKEFGFSNFFNRFVSPILKLRELRKKGIKFDVIHSFSAARFFVLRTILAKKIVKSKDVKTIHTLKSYSRFRLGNKFARLLNFADIITVPTKTFAKDLIKKGCNKNKIRIIKSYIDIKKYKPLNKQKSKTKVNIKNNFVLYYGSLFENKGPKLLIKAMERVFKENNDLKLVIVVRHEIFEEYKKLVKSLNIEKKVLFIKGELYNIEDYINAADIVALPYIDLIATEGNPSCILEAMACKKPIVTTDLPELREIVEPEKDVLIAISGNSESLAKQINRLLKDKKLQKKLAENAYKKSKEFDVKKITRKFIKLYEDIHNGS